MNEERINKTLDMAERIQSLTPSDDLMRRLKSIPDNVKQGYNLVPKKVIWAAAASIALLIGINSFSYYKYQKSSSEQTTQSQDDAYFSYMKQL